MIALYIILGIILLIGLLLLSRVRLIINFDADLKVYLRFLFIKFNLLPEPSKLPKKKRKKKKESTQRADSSLKKHLLFYAMYYKIFFNLLLFSACI